MVSEHDRIVLACDVPQEGLKAGDVGTVVHIYGQGEAVEVEFSALDGETLAIITLRADQLRPVNRGEITHARPVAAP